jgi:Protein of unknown function (DUF1553)/Protein of unknown function (DUF1549)
LADGRLFEILLGKMRSANRIIAALGLFGALSSGWAATVKPAETAPPPAPPPPAVRALKILPDSLRLIHARDARKVLVLGERTDGGWVDLTAEATVKPASDAVSVDADGYISGAKAGEASVKISAAGQTASLTVTVDGAPAPAVGFVRDIEPILARSGCNQGTCHGSAKGKNGFKLSLRGYDPEVDYQALVNDLSGRRFNRVAVDESLMLLKATGDVPHEGRQAIRPGSRYHGLLRQWIAEGAAFEPVAVARATNITILPETVEIDLAGRRQQFLVIASYPDGTTRDVTREAILTSNNDEIATVKGSTLYAMRRGEMAVLVRYEGLYASREAVIMGDRSGFAFAPMPENNYVDKFINAKLQRMKINPSDLCTDAEFIRRVYLDLTGQPPAPEKVREFLADTTETKRKREALIDALLASPAAADFWANKYADLLQCNSENLGKKGVWVFRNWIRDQFAANRPYDQFVRDLVLAKGSTFETPAGNYLRALRDPGKMTEDVSQTFLGVRFNCNKCHDHPFERWTQNQYYEFGAYFAQVAFKKGTLGRDHFISAGNTYAEDQVSETIVYQNYDGGEMRHLKNDKVMAPKPPFGKARDIAAGEDRRAALADWLVSTDNMYFAKSAVNRFWSYFFGRGIIEPVDDIRAGNPPSNPALLDALREDFVKSGHDVRKLMRTICQSRTYQLSIVANPWNADDPINFSHATPRRLSAEQMLDAVAVATGHRPPLKDLPVEMRAVQAADGMVGGNDFLTLFGRPKRQSACECERSSNVTLAHALNLINGPTLGDCITSGDSRFAKLVAAEKDDRKVVEEVYLSCLGRPPTDKEAAQTLGESGKRLEGAQDLAWALMNSPAFLFNR